MEDQEKFKTIYPELNYIPDKTDGWLTDDGKFYPCSRTQHDECADFILKRKKWENMAIHLMGTYEENEKKAKDWKEGKISSRQILWELNYALVSSGIVEPFTKEFTYIQLKKLDDAQIRIDEKIEVDFDDFERRLKIIKKAAENFNRDSKIHIFDNHGFETITMGEYLENFFDDPTNTPQITDDEESAKKLFKLFSRGFKEEFTIHYPYNRDIFRTFPDEKIAVRYSTYFHDGLSGGMSGYVNSYVTLVPVSFIEDRYKSLLKYEDENGIKLEGNQDYFKRVRKSYIDENVLVAFKDLKLNDTSVSETARRYIKAFLENPESGKRIKIESKDVADEVFGVLTKNFLPEVKLINQRSGSDDQEFLVVRRAKPKSFAIMRIHEMVNDQMEDNLLLTNNVGAEYNYYHERKWPVNEVIGDPKRSLDNYRSS